MVSDNTLPVKDIMKIWMQRMENKVSALDMIGVDESKRQLIRSECILDTMDSDRRGLMKFAQRPAIKSIPKRT